MVFIVESVFLEITHPLLLLDFPFQYAIQSQIRFHGYDPAESIVEAVPRKVRTVRLVSFVLLQAKYQIQNRQTYTCSWITDTKVFFVC